MFPRRAIRPSAAVLLRAVRSRGYAEKIVMPALSPTMEAGTIAAWKKNVGDTLKPGEVLCAVETDKATLDFEWNGDEGIVAQLALKPGHDPVPVGTTIAILASDEADMAEAKAMDVSAGSASKKAPAPTAAAAKPPAPAPAPEAPKAPAAPAPAPAATGTAHERYAAARVRASPAARAVFSDRIKGSGPNGRIVQADVDAFLRSAPGSAPAAAAAGGAPAASAQYEDTPASLMRKSIASRLTASKTEIPHFYLTVDVSVGDMKAFIAGLNGAAKEKEFKITVNDFLVKASALACKKVPATNSQWLGDRIRRFHSVDVSVAVATPTGLITPVVYNADLKGLKEISQDIRTLAALAREGKLTPEQYTGGTFTISNLGSFGVKHFTAIINPPQACILAVGAAQEDTGRMAVTLSCDHRVVDGAIGATWLQEFKRIVEAPASLVL